MHDTSFFFSPFFLFLFSETTVYRQLSMHDISFFFPFFFRDNGLQAAEHA